MFVSLLVLGVIISFFLNGLLLWGISKLFKVTNATYVKSLWIGFVSAIVTSICNFVFTLIGLDIVGYIISLIAGFLVLYYFYKKHYEVSIGKSIGIYITNIVIATIIALAIVLPIRLFVSEPFVVSGDSMSPHLNKGDYIFIDKTDKTYRRDDIIVYQFQSKTSQSYLIKRIIGLPTEKIEIKDGALYINGAINKDAYISTPILGTADITLQSDEYFVLGDNNAQSMDSRTNGPVKTNQIIGKVAGK